MNDILVSICCLTYNHELYVRETLDGFFKQECNFKFEILIHDDASIDNTQDIIREYENKYPDIIKPIYQFENQRSKGRGIQSRFNFPRAKGKYIAICEGDDYWTDPLKLQKQVDFLENNPDYALVFHKVKVWQKDGSVKDDFLTKLPRSWETIEDMARYGQYIQTPSCVFRNIEFSTEFTEAPVGDYVLQMQLAEHGKIKYMDEAMAVYRYKVGSHSTLEGNTQNRLFHYSVYYLWKYFDAKGNKPVAKILLHRLYYLMYVYRDNSHSDEIAKFLRENLDDELFKTFVIDGFEYFQQLAEEKSEGDINQYLRNSSIIHLLKIIFYKLKQKLGLAK